MKRSYSDDERSASLAALLANGGDLSKTSREVGVPVETLRAWSKGTRHPEAMQMREGKKLPLADRLQALAEKLIGVVEKKADELAGKDAMIAAGIAVDKMQLLRGQPTGISRNENHDVTDAHRAAALHGLLARVEAANIRSPGNGHADRP